MSRYPPTSRPTPPAPVDNLNNHGPGPTVGSSSRFARPSPPTSRYASPGPAPGPRARRSSYPTFLSFPETLWIQLTWLWRGVFDASRWDSVISLVLQDPEIRTNILKSVLLNGLSLTFILAYNVFLSPLLFDSPPSSSSSSSSSSSTASNGHARRTTVHRKVGWVYQAVWIVPVVSVSLYLNTSWCDRVAKRAYALHHGARNAPGTSSSSSSTRKNTYNTFLTSLATSAYRIAMLSTSLVVSFSLGYVPVVGRFLEFAFFCWIDAYYCYEFLWIARSYSLAQRVRHLEERWAFYFGFGAPATMLCWWGTPLTNAALFALALPCYIIMAMKGNPGPQYPYSPASGASDMLPSPFIPIRLRIFAPIIFLNDWLVRIISSIGSGSSGGRGHRRSGSDSLDGRSRGGSLGDNMESMEAGGIRVGGGGGRDAYEMRSKTRAHAAAASGAAPYTEDVASWKRQ